MTKVYIVIKDEEVIHSDFDRDYAIDMAKEASGLAAGISVANVAVWETEVGHKGEGDSLRSKIIWLCEWEASGPLEPNVFSSNSVIPPNN